MRLTPRQQRFVDEYLLDLNGTQAAIRAGYSVNGAEVQGSQLLSNPKVKARVDRALAQRANRIQVKQDDVVRELLRIAMANPADAYDANGALLPIREMPENLQRAISGIEVEEIYSGRGEERVKIGEVRKVKFWDKPRALEMLGKHVGLLRDRTEENKPTAVFNLVINGIRAMQKELPTVDAKALPAQTIDRGTGT